MSAALYALRLMWLDSRGDFAACGLHVHITRRPALLLTMGIEEIQYEPALRVYWCRDLQGAPREMRRDESITVCAWLTATATAMRSVLQEDSDVEPRPR